MPVEIDRLLEAAKTCLATEKTPALLMDKRLIKAKYEEFRTHFGQARVYYAVKSNPHPTIVTLLNGLGCDFEISSLGELQRLLSMGIPSPQITVGNPVKDPSLVKLAHDSGIGLTAFDSHSEIEKLAALAPGIRVGVRLTVPNDGSEWPLTKKFGVEADQAVELLVQAKKSGLRPVGIFFHVGSQCTLAGTWAKAIEKSWSVWQRTRKRGVELHMLNLGGGFPATYLKPIPTLGEIAKVIHDSLAAFFPKDTEVSIAPGRGLVGEAGVLAATVMAKAVRDGEQWLYLDVGVFNGLMEAVGGIKYRFVPSRNGPTRKWVLSGPTCDSFDVISNEVELPDLDVGERVYIPSAGAYTTAYASHFDGFPIPAVHFLE
ncbi:MAG: type III PLP-dependent enzyme [Dehalococcoidia bacterium]|nr:type III PLP-dependent enzyme [Dehalococcoidia bacterium]